MSASASASAAAAQQEDDERTDARGQQAGGRGAFGDRGAGDAEEVDGFVPVVRRCGGRVLGGVLAPGRGCGAASRPARQSANWPMMRSPTSAITPRPNCAGRPVTARSVVTETTVAPSFSARVPVTVARAVPWPRTSLPRAASTTRCAVPSRSSKTAVPR